MLLLKAAEKQVEQTFSGRFARTEPENARKDKSGNGRLAAPTALIGQLVTQRLLHRIPNLNARAAYCPALSTLVRVGKRGIEQGRGDEKESTSPASEGSVFQILARLEQPAEGKAGLRKIFDGAFLAVHHGQHKNDFAAGVAHGVDRLQR